MMTDQQHPIVLSPELVEKWASESPIQANDENWAYELYIAHQAARWGADEQLELDAAWVAFQPSNMMSADRLRATMRPKPPSLKEQALGALYAIATGADDIREFHQDIETIKTALEQLDD